MCFLRLKGKDPTRLISVYTVNTEKRDEKRMEGGNYLGRSNELKRRYLDESSQRLLQRQVRL